MPKWIKGEVPEEITEVLAEVAVGGVCRFTVLKYQPAIDWWEENGVMFEGGIVRWTLLDPLTIEREDHREADIKRVVEFFTQLNGGSLDRSGKSNRDCKTLFSKLKHKYPKQDPEDVAMRLLAAVKRDTFHGPRATNFYYVYEYLNRIINDLRDGKRAAPSDKLAGGLSALDQR